MLRYFPGLSDFIPAGFALLVFLAWSVVGAAAGGRSRRTEFDPLVGWAILCLPFVLLGTLTTLSFVWVDLLCVLIFVAASIVCARQRIDIDVKGWIPFVSLVIPFLVFVAPTGAYGWDQLSHWIPNIDFITAHQHFPGHGLPASPSMHAGYPYGFALAVYWVEMLARQFVNSVAPVGVAAAFNVLLFAVAARTLAEKLRGIHGGEAEEEKASLGAILFAKNIWLAASLSLLAVTALSPTFLPTNSISAAADNPTAIALLAIAFAILPTAETRQRTCTTGLVQLSLILVLAVFLKEDNAVPAAALLAGRVIWDAKVGGQPLRTLRDFALASVPMLVVAVLWHGYAYLQIPQGEMALRVPSQWRPDLLPQILSGMALVLVQKIGFFVCLVPTLYIAARALLRKPVERDVVGAFAVIAAAGFVGYTLFLAFAYISIFAEGEAERQAAFWRYETHLGLVLECAVILLLCRIAVRRRPIYGRLAAPAAATMLLAPLMMAPVIRPDLDPQTLAIREMAHAVNAQIGGARDMAVVDQFGNGAPCPMFVYESGTPLKLAECVTKITRCKACMIRKAAEEEEFIWSNGWSPELAQATNLQLDANASYLLKRAQAKWSVIGRWPKTPTKTRGVRAIWQVS